MNALDRFIQRWRISKVTPWIRPADRVLDIGTDDAALFRFAKCAEGVGIDPFISESKQIGHVKVIKGWFPVDMADEKPFDAITLLAVLEHIPTEQQSQLAADCARFLKPGGKVLITVPSPQVDHILAVLQGLRILDADSLHQHYGFDPKKTPEIFSSAGLKLIKKRKFQLGLNNLFVFEKSLPLF